MTTPLNDLIHRLTRLAAVSGCTITVRLLGGEYGNALELKATQTAAAEAREYTRQLTLPALSRHGAVQLAADFVREARLAFAAGATLSRRTPLPVAARRTRL